MTLTLCFEFPFSFMKPSRAFPPKHNSQDKGSLGVAAFRGDATWHDWQFNKVVFGEVLSHLIAM